MPGKNENRESMTKGEGNMGKREKKTVKADMSVGSCNGDGVRFPLPDHPDLSNVMRTPETK
jgi:hypothetical protein